MDELELDRFEAHYFGRASVEDQREFNKALADDTELMQRYRVFKISVEGIRSEGTEGREDRTKELRERLAKIDRSMAPPNNDGGILKWWPYAVAASLLVGIAGWWFFQVNEHVEWATEYAHVEPGLPVLMSSGPSAMDAIMNAYKLEQYEEASDLISTALSKDPKNDTLLYFRAVILENTVSDREAVLARTMACHPWYVQQLAHFTWSMPGKRVGEADLRGALDLLMATNQPLYQRECEIMNKTQINIIKAILSDETQLTSARVMREYQLGTPRNVQKARLALEGNDVIDRSKAGYQLLDPGFALWFGREFLGKPIMPL